MMNLLVDLHHLVDLQVDLVDFLGDQVDLRVDLVDLVDQVHHCRNKAFQLVHVGLYFPIIV